MTDNALYVERQGDIAYLILNRPDKLNAVTQKMWEAFPSLLADLEEDLNVKVLVIRGVDDSAFAAGADIAELKRVHAQSETSQTYSKAVADAEESLHKFPKPTLALIQGPCIGGGCAIALCCDIRFADTSARLGITPAKLGIAYSLAQTKRLVDVVGTATAKSILYTGNIISAEEAFRVHLIDHLIEGDDLEHHVTDFARSVAASSQFSTRATKHFIHEILNGTNEDTTRTREIIQQAFAGEDFKEGTAAFIDKRKPIFPYRGE